MTQKAVVDDVDIILISEQYMKPETQTWYEDISRKAAIMVRNGSTRIDEVCEENSGFVYVTINGIRFYSCYFSPNIDHETFVRMIGHLESSVRTAKGKVVIGGDFNSKSPEWGSSQMDHRGAVVGELVGSLGLVVYNEGDSLTFRRADGGSVIDITFGSANLCSSELNWHVLEDLTLSDHQYISFNIKRNETAESTDVTLPKWNVRRLNISLASNCIAQVKARSTLPTFPEEENVGDVVSTTMETIEKICNAGMPKCKKYRNKNPVYWWSTEISGLRTLCLAARRDATRHPHDETRKKEYKRIRKELRMAIRASKRKCWIQLCEEVDNDPWGKPYKIVMKRTGARKPIPGIKEPKWSATIVKTLFPLDKDGLVNKTKLTPRGLFTPFNLAELQTAIKRLKNGKTPGPDGVPNEIVKLLGDQYPELLLETFNICFKKGIFPQRWKRQKLVLLRKGSKPLSEPSSYRPLCMLDTMGKLLESLLLHRLEKNVEESGGLSDMQHGFRKGKSTVDAIREVVDIATVAKKNLGFCAIITLDVRNAFNTVKWNVVLDAIKGKTVNDYLYNMIADYLENRILLYDTEVKLKEYQITSGVPQGSVLGPFLWNVMYDDLLNLNMHEGGKLVGYADDIALVVAQPTTELIEIVANGCLSRCDRWLRRHGLQLAAAKTEAILVTDRRRFEKPKLVLQNNSVELKKSLLYLGVQLDNKLSFKDHVEIIRDKAIRTAHVLARIMPNSKGPKASTRKLINSVVHSQLLYAAPSFSSAMGSISRVREMEKPQRISALRVISAYRTVSTCSALVLAGIPPIDLLVLEREEIYNEVKLISPSCTPNERRKKKDDIKSKARDTLVTKWQAQWMSERNGRWTFKLIPNISAWLSRRHGEMNYYLTQAFTDHGCFNSYLKRFCIKESEECILCGSDKDDSNHNLFECQNWAVERNRLNMILGLTISADNIVNVMLESQEKWQACEDYIARIMKTKGAMNTNP